MMQQSKYETILDEATGISWTRGEGEAEQFRSRREELFHLFISAPDEALPVLLNALRVSDPYRSTTAIAILDRIGYPTNELAITKLVFLLGANDPNSPVWQAAALMVSHLGPDIVVPYLLQALLERGEPYHRVSSEDPTQTTWAEDLDGLSMLLSRTSLLESEYALRCCPTVTYLLSRIDLDPSITSDVADALLAIIAKAGSAHPYMLPMLLNVSTIYRENEVGKRVRELLLSLPEELRTDYRCELNY